MHNENPELKRDLRKRIRELEQRLADQSRQSEGLEADVKRLDIDVCCQECSVVMDSTDGALCGSCALARTEELEAEVERLLWAARGGNAQRDTADLLTFMADRFVSEHGEGESTDWIRAAYERARMLRAALAPAEAGEKDR